MTTQSLYGSVTEYNDIESKVDIIKGTFHQIIFNVTNQENKPFKCRQNTSGTLYSITYIENVIKLEQGLRHYYDPKTGYKSAERLQQKGEGR